MQHINEPGDIILNEISQTQTAKLFFKKIPRPFNRERQSLQQIVLEKTGYTHPKEFSVAFTLLNTQKTYSKCIKDINIRAKL